MTTSQVILLVIGGLLTGGLCALLIALHMTDLAGQTLELLLS